MTKQELLKTHFGYDTFREGQEAVIDALLEGKDVLAVMPTGAGKSICYQVPALMMKGITLVISPLISLMKDQVRSLNQAGISAAYLNSSLTQGQYFTALRYAKAGRYPIIYVAPERLTTEAFLDFALSADISMIAVDESHCVSQWGQDFRPSYLKIAEFVAQLPKRPVISAFTATGLAIGIILFFNHAGKIKLNDDPTPFEVQMRLYERDVNDTLMINAGRKGEEADVDS